MTGEVDSNDVDRGSRITKLIDQTDLYDYQVADACEISSGQLSKIKKGAGFSLPVLRRLSEILHCTTDFIVTGKEPLPGFNLLNPQAQHAVLTLIENLGTPIQD